MTVGELPGGGVLERARVVAVLTSRELWLRYVGLGGDGTPADVHSYLAGEMEPTRREYNLLVDALNERLTDLGLVPSVRYAA